jgi:hypothetical protein
MEPFDYPAEPHVRRHGRQGYAAAESYRPWLRDEFSFRCVFCLTRERWEGPVGRFAIDHLRPEATHAHLLTNYDNLLYVCVGCNAIKGDQEVADPTQVLLRSTVEIGDSGELMAKTSQAAELIELLNLNYFALCQRRQLLIAAIRVFHQHDRELYNRWLGFPDDLPELARLRPPRGNTRPEGSFAIAFCATSSGQASTHLYLTRPAETPVSIGRRK